MKPIIIFKDLFLILVIFLSLLSPGLRGSDIFCTLVKLSEALERVDPAGGGVGVGTLLHDIDTIDFVDLKKFDPGGPIHTLVEKYAKLVNDAGGALTEDGAKGAFRLSACLVKSDGLDFTQHLRDAFTKGGNFKGAEFDTVMKKLVDVNRLTFNAKDRIFTSLRSGLIYERMDFNEGHRINHILKGHTDNDWSVGEGKSLFANPDEVFDLIDDGWLSVNKLQPNPVGNPSRWEVDFHPRIIGSNNETKLRLIVDQQTKIITTAFPIH